MANAVGQGSLIGAALGVFKVDALIGRGAMGAVYLAQDTRLNRRVALKVLLGSLARNKEVVAQFYREAKAAAPLNHPNIVRVYEAGVQENTPYIAMEFVDGEPLDRFLRRVGQLEWQQAFHIAGQVAQALDCAHSHGVVHRDVKPANILLEKTGRVRLTDFGIANLHAEQSEGPPVIGTPQYMSPEQCKGNAVGPASDLFSLGITIYQMIAAELPFKGDSSMAMVRSICTEDPKRLNKILPNVPDDVARVVAFLMEKQPERRPASARVVESLLTRVQKEKGGRSALPDALTAFLKDQTEARPFAGTQSRTPKPTRDSSKHSNGAGKTPRRLPWPILGRVAAVVVLAALATAAAPALNVLSRDTTAAAAPQLELAKFTNGPRGQVASLLLNGYRVDGLEWTADANAVLVRARGLDGGLTHGASGLLAVVPDEFQALSVIPPAGPALVPDYWSSRLQRISGPAPTAIPDESPLHNAVVVGVRSTNDTVVLLAQRWDEAAPRPDVLYRQSPGTGVAGLGDEVRGAVIHPDGHRLALVIHDGLYNADYIVERDVELRDLTLASEPLTSTRGDIDPASIQYSRDGKYLYYLRRLPGSDPELCQAASNGDAQSERSIYAGVASTTFALQHQGDRIALEYASKDQPRELIVIDTAGSARARIGSGTITQHAWAGDQLVVRATDPESGHAQLWLVDPLLAGSQSGWTQITQEPGGVDTEFAVSPDGRRVAVALATADGPAVLLAPLPTAAKAQPPRV